ncbi:hypothetical protein [Rhizobium sp. Leaf321]|uniref:hypothetical protein n=1 Tax=Rhizobium sp. Leaf321 TaxID=1736335 RepID=UPI000AFCFF57|nr:hypothetical protein [Rhizobium sp. Leaf321]
MEGMPPKYHMRVGEITFHYREVCALLTRHDIDAAARAKICGLAEQTLKGYGALDGTTAHRKITVEALDKLREAAMDAYWEAAAEPYREKVRYAREDNRHIVPTLIALCGGMMRERHIHPLRVLERADTYGGHVIDTTGAPVAVELDELAELRSRWRKAAHRCSWQDTDGYMTRQEFLCEVADCCPYSLWRIGSEFYPWAIQPTKAMVERLEDAVAELERDAA